MPSGLKGSGRLLRNAACAKLYHTRWTLTSQHFQSGNMSLCFLQAVAKANLPEGGITQQEFFNHLLSHFQGVRHPQDSISSIGDTLASIQPWVGSLREVALASDYKPLEGKLASFSRNQA